MENCYNNRKPVPVTGSANIPEIDELLYGDPRQPRPYVSRRDDGANCINRILKYLGKTQLVEKIVRTSIPTDVEMPLNLHIALSPYTFDVGDCI